MIKVVLDSDNGDVVVEAVVVETWERNDLDFKKALWLTIMRCAASKSHHNVGHIIIVFFARYLSITPTPFRNGCLSSSNVVGR